MTISMVVVQKKRGSCSKAEVRVMDEDAEKQTWKKLIIVDYKW